MKNKEELNETELKIYSQLLDNAFYYGTYDCETKRSGWSRESTRDLESTISTGETLVSLLGGESFRDFILTDYDAFTQYMKGVASYLKYDDISKLPEDLNKIDRYDVLDFHLDEEDQEFVRNTIRELQTSKED